MNESAEPNPAERLYPFVRRTRGLMVGREALRRSVKQIHFLLVTTDLSAGSLDDILHDFRDVPVVQHHHSLDLEHHFGLRGTKVIGFKKSTLSQSIYSTLKAFRVTRAERAPSKPKVTTITVVAAETAPVRESKAEDRETIPLRPKNPQASTSPAPHWRRDSRPAPGPRPSFRSSRPTFGGGSSFRNRSGGDSEGRAPFRPQRPDSGDRPAPRWHRDGQSAPGPRPSFGSSRPTFGRGSNFRSQSGGDSQERTPFRPQRPDSGDRPAPRWHRDGRPERAPAPRYGVARPAPRAGEGFRNPSRFGGAHTSRPTSDRPQRPWNRAPQGSSDAAPQGARWGVDRRPPTQRDAIPGRAQGNWQRGPRPPFRGGPDRPARGRDNNASPARGRSSGGFQPGKSPQNPMRPNR